MRKLLATIAVLCLGVPAWGAAQMPTDPVGMSRRTFREEHIERTYTETRAAMTAWIKAIDTKDKKAIRRMVTDDVLFAPSEGWMALGPAALDSLATWTPRLSALGFTPIDFDASGSMATVYGGVYYQLASPAGRATVSADATIVWVQRGRDWRIRSWVERPRARLED